MRLQSPPVIEVGIEFHFEPRPDKPPWDLPVAQQFIEQLKPTFADPEVFQAEQIRIEKRSTVGMPEVISGQVSLDRIRTRNKDGTRWVQVGNDLLVCNLVRQGKEYPGFSPLRTDALAVLDRYVQEFQPVCVRDAAVTYLDLIELPFPSEGKVVRLEDYYRLNVQFPEEQFGPVALFSLQLLFPPAEKKDQLTLIFQSLPAIPGTNVLRSQMFWQCRCADIRSLDQSNISDRLEAAHIQLRSCFQASFTEKGWALFRPLEEK